MNMGEERKQSVLRIAEATQYPGTFESLSLPYASWPACRLRREDKSAEFAVPILPHNRCTRDYGAHPSIQRININSSWRPAYCSFRLGSAHSKGRRLNVYM